MVDRSFIFVLKYSFLTALYLILFVVLTLIVSHSNTSILAAANEQTKSETEAEKSRKRAEYFDNFHYNQLKLDEWIPAEFTDDVTESEIEFSISYSELSVFAEILQRAKFTSKTREQKDMVHRFASVLEKKQRTFLTSARLFTERRLNNYLNASDIRVYVPPMRNSVLEIYGPNLNTAENRQDVIGRYRTELYMVRFKQILWKPSPDGELLEETRMNSYGDGMFIIDRRPGANTVFAYHH